MNERIKELLAQSVIDGVPQLDIPDDIDYEKFAELIIKECLDIMTKEEHNTTMLTCNPMVSGAIWDAKWKIKEHFGVK